MAVETTSPAYGGSVLTAWLDNWIDGVERTLDARNQMFINGLRSWQRVTSSYLEFLPDPAGAASAVAATTSRLASTASATVTEAASAIDDAVTRQVAAADDAAEAAAAAMHPDLDALTVEQLDRLAETNHVDDYPSTGTKADKVAALVATGPTYEALTVEHLDRIAAANKVEDYPQSATKAEKIAALEAAARGLTATT
jgi:hypothetical protein